MKFIYSIVILISLTSCQSKQKQINAPLTFSPDIEAQKKCEIWNEDEKFKLELFPFSFKDYNTQDVKQYFADDVVIDSMENNNDGYITRDYSFKKGNSYIGLFVKPDHKEDSWYYLNDCFFDENILRFKNGIKVGMDKNKVIDIEGLGFRDCDTLHLIDGDGNTDYCFIFKQDKLNTIEIDVPVNCLP